MAQEIKEGREEVEDDSRSRRPSASRTEVNVKWVRQVVRGDNWLTVRKITSQLDLTEDSVWKIITEDLGMHKVSAEMVPRLLNDDQKE